MILTKSMMILTNRIIIFFAIIIATLCGFALSILEIGEITKTASASEDTLLAGNNSVLLYNSEEQEVVIFLSTPNDAEKRHKLPAGENISISIGDSLTCTIRIVTTVNGIQKEVKYTLSAASRNKIYWDSSQERWEVMEIKPRGYNE